VTVRRLRPPVVASLLSPGVTGTREATYGRPENTYNHLQSTYVQSTLDYIFVRYQDHVLIRANQSVNDFKVVNNERLISISDHSAVVSDIEISFKTSTRQGQETIFWSGNQPCTTVDSPNPRRVCHFPFLYQGREYSRCITSGNEKAWCGLDFLAEDWGYCDSQVCPKYKSQSPSACAELEDREFTPIENQHEMPGCWDEVEPRFMFFSNIGNCLLASTKETLKGTPSSMT